MTLKNSSSNKIDMRTQVLGKVSRSTWQTALYALIFFFALPIATMLMTQNFTTDFSSHAANIISQLIANGSGVLSAIICIMAVVSGINAFSYLHSKKQNDFYHSAPISRTKLFFTNYFSGMTSFFATYLVGVLLALGVVLVMGFAPLLDYAYIFKWVFLNISVFISLYTLVVFAAQLTGSVITNVLMSGVLVGIIPIFTWLYLLYMQDYFATFYQNDVFFSKFLSYVTPIGIVAATKSNQVLIAALWLGISALLCALSVFIYKKRRSEDASRAVIFAAPRTILKYAVCIVASALFGNIFDSASNGGIIWIVFGFISGGFIAHAIMEIIYHYDFKALFTNIRGYCIFTVLFCACVIPVAVGAIPYDTYLPSREKIVAVSVNLSSSYNGELTWRDDNVTFISEPDFIDSVYAISENGIANLDSIETYQTAGAYVTFKLENGKTVRRAYNMINSEQTYDLQKIVYMNDEQQKAKHSLFEIELSTVSEITVNPSTISGTALSYPTTNAEVTAEIMAAMGEDILSMSAENISTAKPIGTIEITQKIDSNSDYAMHSNSYQFGILSEYEKTLAVLHKHGMFTAPDVDVSKIKHISAVSLNDEILSRALNEGQTGIFSEYTTDTIVIPTEDYSDICARIVPINLYSSYNPFLETDDLYVEIILDDYYSTKIEGFLQK